VLAAHNSNLATFDLRQYANSRPSNCIAAHYKIAPTKVADKLAIKIICDKKWRVCFILLVKYDVHTTCKIKSIHATFCHILLLYETKSTEQMLHVDRIRYKKCSQTELKWCWTRKWMN